MTYVYPIHPYARSMGAKPRPSDADELPARVPLPSTGTVDDDDEPEDEHDRENEAPEHEKSEATELPEEFE